MKKRFLLLLALLPFCKNALAQNADSVDVVKYTISLDVAHEHPSEMLAKTVADVRIMRPLRQFTLDFSSANVDSVFVDGVKLDSVIYDNRYLTITVPAGTQVGDTLEVAVFYHGRGYLESNGIGGFHFDNDIIYNLGCAFDESPHTFGRAWFPCRDNFYDKSLIEYSVTVDKDLEVWCSGVRDSVCLNVADSSRTFHFSVKHPISTYLSSVTIGNFRGIQRTLQSVYGSYPLHVSYLSGDSASISRNFDLLEDVLPKYETCFGPYRWERLGYVATPYGSMEHVGNISLVGQCVSDNSTVCQSVIAHELSHSWFGNLVTCAREGDMWFNEGGASFCEELAMEAVFGKEAANEYYQQEMEKVIRTMHHEDSCYRPIAGNPTEYTYSNTVYDKGAMVFHSLRGYLGDSLFYASLRKLFDRNEYKSLTTLQIRDSLSLYSGVDLTKFFDFHVLGPGFAHFSIDSMRTNGNDTRVFMRQKLVGTTAFADGNRVPVTFFSENMDTVTKILSFDGEFGDQRFSLPFEPRFAIVDFYKDLSDAITDGWIFLKSSGRRTLPQTFIETSNFNLRDTNFIHISHNFVKPDPMKRSTDIVKRLANRYWKIEGDISGRISGRFYAERFSSMGNPNLYLDENFWEDVATTDSMVLLYRPDAASDWHYEESTYEGNTAKGYFCVSTLKTGEYALAVVDTARIGTLGAETPRKWKIGISPNPASESVKVSVCGGLHGLDLSIYDSEGKTVLRKKGISSEETIDISSLQSGLHIVRILDGGEVVYTDKLIVK